MREERQHLLRRRPIVFEQPTAWRRGDEVPDQLIHKLPFIGRVRDDRRIEERDRQRVLPSGDVASIGAGQADRLQMADQRRLLRR
jgi:hypothetical protein